ncbi:hypothetical protein M406DRAFT_99196 [Cryphonectria parasitica EP155]|uniref:Autophagy-related protein 2 n=1 Tax=Cryphonectria parasitica (strain ATCC 38755 / EP155) TaxID=660469 RepID=A0A9P4XXT1_CRYP1|nr:uncharacterized protein M406DRAFT_99196 [Cryphonectria parasitica EP155]KAF3762878.1 hypothetical protein M406DRAFT_99196 [Cryphonectria parasitica EP155]
MAGIFQSFRTSAMPKRLLRYAMARFDIFEDDALDLENLDLGFGLRNTLEFKDVGLKVDKLTKQLALPPEYRIKQAAVSRLQVTVPLDLYSSSIELTAVGVRICLEISSVDIQKKPASEKEEQRKKKKKQEEEEEEEGTAAPDLVPTAADLAQSFLDTQPVQEKKALEDALAAERHDLAASVVSSEDGSEDDATFGTGQGLSLPVFLTDFLQGVADRTRITIRDVAFHLDVEVPVEPKSLETEPVSLQLCLDELHVEGLTKQVRDDESSKIVPKEGKRHILLSDIRASLVSQAGAFSSFVRSPSTTSAASQASVAAGLDSPQSAAPGLVPDLHSPQTEAEPDDRAHSPRLLDDSEEALQIPYEIEEWGGSGDAEQLEEEPASSLSTPRASIYHDFSGNTGHQPGLSPPGGDDVPEGPTASATLQTDRDNDVLAGSTSSDSASDDSGAQASEDLVQSHYFSHEEAESMYMTDLCQEALPPKPGTPSLVQKAVASEEQIADPQKGPVVPIGVTPSLSEEVREVLCMDSISVYVPTGHQHLHVSSEARTGNLAESAFQNVPGAFSMHSSVSQTPTHFKSHAQAVEDSARDDAVEVHVAPISVQFDASIGLLLAMVACRLLEVSKRSPKAPDQAGSPAAQQPAVFSMPDLRFFVQKISVSFMDKISGLADTGAAKQGPGTDSSSETLLRAEFGDLRAIMSESPSSKEAGLTLGDFHFGYPDSDILSFDRDAQMYMSTRDKFPDPGVDISVKMTTNAEGSRGIVNTLPLRVHIDLQRLDETLNWFGGLSSVLQMGASMTSSGPRPQRKPTIKPSKPRGVRFDIPSQPESADPGPGAKWDVRIGGLSFDLVGRTCSMLLRASAVKASNRGTALRVHISKIHASGPHNKKSSGEPRVNITVTGSTLEFLTSPRDEDLDRLLGLIIPSKDQYDDGDDEIMVDTLLRQRRKGSVVALTLDDVQVRAGELHQLDAVSALGEEIARLGAVTKYLPEDDRPGLLTLGVIYNIEASVDVGGRFGMVSAHMKDLELAHITFPSLAAFSIGSIEASRNNIEELVGSAKDPTQELAGRSPVLMVRMIGDQMEPVIRVRMRNLIFEYRVPTVMDLLGLSSETTPQEFDATLAASVANLGERAHHALIGSELAPRQSLPTPQSETTKPTVFNVAFRDCLLGLNPLGLTSKLAILLIETSVEASMPADGDVSVVANLKKAAILLIDDVSLLDAPPRPGPSRHRGSDAQRQKDMLSALCSKGYVNICQISSARATVQVTNDADGEKHIDVELRDDLLVLETCADSTHTLIILAGALKPPTPPSREIKFKTEVIPMQDMLASVTADAFGRAEGNYDFDDDFTMAQELDGGDELSEVSENLFDATSSSMFSNQTTKQGSKTEEPEFGIHSEIEVHENFFAMDPRSQGKGHRWNSARNTYDEVQEEKIRKSPLKARVRDVHVIWNLFDGYDWQHTRESITKTVEEVENQAFERRARSGRRSLEDPDFDDDDVVGDCLFNSIYVSIPANHDPRELVGGINHQLDDTESIAATTLTTATTRAGVGQFQSRAKKLRLGRSRRHKITFELAGVNVDLVQYPPGSGETDTSIDVRVHSLDVFDHVPTSTWKKFATYNLDAGEREIDTSMVHIELLLVKPVPDLAAIEHVLKVTVLPLRLHVDQDALDFITRFFQFKDESQAPAHASPSDEAFIQRAEVMDIPVVLDFKPKRVDYAGLRGGRSSEFMNFVILESARLTLKHVILYGVPGWERLGNTLNDTWTPNVKEEQLAGVLAGVAPVRPLVNVGSGFRDLIEIPIKEYKKDGRIVRSIGKGAVAFARTTGTEIVKLGAKVAVGTQYVLQGAEGMLTNNPAEGSSAAMREYQSAVAGWEEEDDAEPEEKKQISLYADQPTGVIQGLRHAYSSLARDLNVARDAIIAVPAEVMESQNAHGAARAVMRRAPTIIFRPAIGATRAVGQALMGATNAMDPENLRRVDDSHRNTNQVLEDDDMPETLSSDRQSIMTRNEGYEQLLKTRPHHGSRDIAPRARIR